MRKEYDFSNSEPSPYVARLKKPVTIRLDVGVVDYFKSLADDTGIPYQSLINLFLQQCVRERRRPEFVAGTPQG